MLRYRQNPFRAAAARRMWGPRPSLALAAAVLVAVVAAPWLPRVESFFPWFLVDVSELVWSIPALFGMLVAWRVRKLRSSPPDLTETTLPVDERATHYFEAAAMPLAAAALAMAIGASLSIAASPLLTGTETIWPGVLAALHDISRSLATAAVTAGVWSIQRDLRSGFGKLMSAGFALLVMRMVIGLVMPWMTFAWNWVPRLGHHLGPMRTVVGTHLLFNLVVAATAWAMLHATASDGLEWRTPEPEEEAKTAEGP